MMKIYGCSISYYTGKLEAYLRYKNIPYELLGTEGHRKHIMAHAGMLQMPMVERADGRWLSDSTPILLQLEREHPETSILPANPVVRFIAHLMEDYADEYLWRPAMHYRWSYAHDREHAASIITDELLGHLSMPRFWKRRLVKRRQLGGFVHGDGVRAETWDHVEAGYLNALDGMTRMLEDRPFLLGEAPSLADFGFVGPMFRHFGQDPTPVEIMRQRAPAVYEWVARMWNLRSHKIAGNSETSFVANVPDDAAPMLQEICETHLAQLAANAAAFAAGPGRFSMTIQGCDYVDMPVSRYRVACLEDLRAAFAGLGEADQDAVRALLPFPEAEILWAADIPAPSNYVIECEKPIAETINVYAKGVPE
jgi:glutathione S-transferase